MKAVTKKFLLGLFLAAVVSSPAHAGENGYTIKATDVREQPFFDAKSIVTLPEKTVVEILVRQGGWMQVKTADGKQGWIRLLSVSLGSPDQKTTQSSGSVLSALGIGSHPKPATNSTVTTGVRGFSAEDLAKARPNPREVEKMKSFAANDETAKASAQSGKLVARQVAYFDEKGKPIKVKK
jgi:hypothetical protein